MRIDSHHHFWQYDPVEYDWISESMPAIRRDFLPADLEPEIRAAGIDGVVSVQARQTLDETRWLLELANEHEFIKGVVGWVALAEPDVRDQLSALAGEPKLNGIRHIVQGEPDDNFILRDDFNRGVAALKDFGLTYDILIYERHLPQAIKFVDRHPQQVFVLDHLAKPRAKENLLEPWATNIRPIGRAPERLLQALRPHDRGRLEHLDRAATAALLGDNLRSLRPAAAHVRQRLARLPAGVDLRHLARPRRPFLLAAHRQRASPHLR